LIKVKKDEYEDKEVVRYHILKIQKPNWKKESKGILKKIENYLSKLNNH